MNKPFVLLVKTALGCYFYEVNRNEIVAVNSELYKYIEAVQKSSVPDEVSVSKEVFAQYRTLQECGYLSSNHIENIIHPATTNVRSFLNRGVQKLTLQVTQRCNLRCKYCIYSEKSNLEQRSHSSLSMSLDTAKRAIDFYYEHSIDCEQIVVGFYGGEPLLAFPLIKDIVKVCRRGFSGQRIVICHHYECYIIE